MASMAYQKNNYVDLDYKCLNDEDHVLGWKEV